MSAQGAETYARQAQSSNKTTDEKIELIAKSLVELAKVVGKIQSDILSMR